MKQYETPTALLLDVNKKLEAENKKLRKDIDIAYRFLLTNEVPKITMGMNILKQALSGGQGA